MTTKLGLNWVILGWSGAAEPGQNSLEAEKHPWPTSLTQSNNPGSAAPFGSRALLKSKKGAGCQVTRLENQRGERERGFVSSQTLFQVFYMASFFYTLNYVWNLYKGIKEKYCSCMDGYSVQVHICPAARAAKHTIDNKDTGSKQSFQGFVCSS